MKQHEVLDVILISQCKSFIVSDKHVDAGCSDEVPEKNYKCYKEKWKQKRRK